MVEAPDPKRNPTAQAAKYLGVGLTWAGSTALFLYLGSLLDGVWGTEPWLALVGAFVGAAAGFYNLYRQVAAETRRPGRKQETDQKE
jgi:F0F1-type ATP synthase assembly protein I